jgi:hypothetical protein
MTRATNTGTLKRKGKRKRLLPKCSRCPSAQRNGDKLFRKPFIGLKLMSPMGQMCVSLCPDSFSRSQTCMDPNQAEGPDNLHRHTEALRELRETLMTSLKEGGRKAINMNKVTDILKKSDESPAQFYDRLYKANHLYSPFNPKAPENQ